MRKVIFHFHLFKNAGTSVDTILKKNLSDQVVHKEFNFHPYNENVRQVIDWIRSENDAIAFSSHTARLFNFKTLEKEGIKIFPIIFIRHPIVRILSVYRFEKKQEIDTLGSVIARNTKMKGYIEIRWQIPLDSQCKNFHVERLSDFFFYENGSKFEKAIKAVKSLPFIGLVEEFEKSVNLLEAKINEFGIDFKSFIVYKNVTSDLNKSLDEKLEEIKRGLGKKFYDKVVDMNREDLVLWEEVKKMYDNLTFEASNDKV